MLVALTNVQEYEFLYETYNTTHRKIVNLGVQFGHDEDNVLDIVFGWKPCWTLCMTWNTLTHVSGTVYA